MKASLQLQPMYCSRDYNYSSRFNQQHEKPTQYRRKFPISEQGYTVGKLLDGMECQILLDTGASKSFMSKSHYWRCKSLHTKVREFKYNMDNMLVCYLLHQ